MNRFPSRRSLLQWAARAGYAARGAVYLFTGAFAILAATELRNAPTGTGGVLDAAADWPLGEVWLGLVGAGLVGFAAWRAVQAIFDPDGIGADPKGRALRAGKALSAILHLGLAWTAFKLLDSLEDLNEEAEARQEAARLLEMPFGQWLLMGLAAAVMIAAAGNVLKGLRHDFSQDLFCPKKAQAWAEWTGRIGYGARGVALAIVAVFLFLAGRSGDAGEARSIGGAIQALEAQPFGSTAVAALGAGFLAFGVFGMLQAAFRRIRAPEELG